MPVQFCMIKKQKMNIPEFLWGKSHWTSGFHAGQLGAWYPSQQFVESGAQSPCPAYDQLHQWSRTWKRYVWVPFWCPRLFHYLRLTAWSDCRKPISEWGFQSLWTSIMPRHDYLMCGHTGIGIGNSLKKILQITHLYIYIIQLASP